MVFQILFGLRLAGEFFIDLFQRYLDREERCSAPLRIAGASPMYAALLLMLMADQQAGPLQIR